MAYAEQRGKKWRVKYATPAGEKSRSGFATKTAALAWGRQQEAEIQAKRWNDPRKGDTTVAEWIETWIKRQDLADTSAETYAYLVRRHIIPRLGNLPLSSLDLAQINAWAAAIHKRGFSPSTARKARSVLSTILSDAVTERLINANPAYQRRQRGRQDIHVEEESLWCNPYQALLIAERAGLLTGRADEFVSSMLAAYTGMRLGEIRGLERKHAKLGLIDVQWQLREVGNHVFLKAPPKHNRRRKIPLPPFLTRLMSDQQRRTESQLCGCEQHQGDYLFRSPTQDHWRRSAIAALIHKAADARLPAMGKRPMERILTDEKGRYVARRRAETDDRMANPARKGSHATATWLPIVEGFTPHDFKHSHKTWLIGLRIPEVAQAERLAHKIPGIRGRYSHVTPEMRKEIVDGLQGLFEESLKRRARMGPSQLPVLQELLEPHLGPWDLISHIPPIGGAEIIEMEFGQAV